MQSQLLLKILQGLCDRILGRLSIQCLLNFPAYPKPADPPVTLCASRTLHPYPFSGPNASRSSQDLGSYALNNLSRELEIVVDPPDNEPETLTPPRTASPEVLEFECTAGDIPLEATATLRQAQPCFIPISAEAICTLFTERLCARRRDRFYHPPTVDQLGPPAEWTSVSHPEGARYFYHEDKRIFTDANVFDPPVYARLTSYIFKFEDFIRAYNIQLEEDVDIVFDLLEDPDCKGEDQHCRYYMVAHRTRTIFWLDDFSAVDLPAWAEVRGVSCPAHIRHELEAQYWFHCNTFPSAHPINPALVDELRDILIHAVADNLTSTGNTSTAPYNATELQQILGLTNTMRKSASQGLPGSTCSFFRQRFYDFQGHPAVRLDRTLSVHGIPVLKRSLLITLLSPLLFSAPDVHYRSLQKIWVDRLVHSGAWAQFMNKLNSEWCATVLLTANVSFLAIQSVDAASENLSRSAAQISSYISVISSTGCIILGLLLIRQNRTKAKETACDAATFLNEQEHPNHGLEVLAILYSLPYAMLLWAMASFFVAFSFMTFQHSSLSVRLVVGLAWAAIAAFIVWCVRTGWEVRQGEPNALVMLMGTMWGGIKSATVREPDAEDSKSSRKPFRFLLFGRRSSWASTQTVV
ncbi:hypothetical protein C8J56DRAFT_934551 [Mycena floridula]|nr:hypothetical protein C8J56DRAFT_934551 [Mycena floridula]